MERVNEQTIKPKQQREIRRKLQRAKKQQKQQANRYQQQYQTIDRAQRVENMRRKKAHGSNEEVKQEKNNK